MTHLYTLLGASTPFDPSNRFTTSILLPPLALAFLRLLLSLYAFVTIFIIIIYDCTHGQAYRLRKWFSFFTNLTWCGLAFYFLFSGLHTLRYSRRGKSWLSSWPRPLQAAHAIYYTTIVTFPPLVTIVYFVMVYVQTGFMASNLGWANVCRPLQGLGNLGEGC